LKRTTGYIAAAAASAFMLGCAADDASEYGRDSGDVLPRLISVVGCVTAESDRFVLTDLESAGAEHGEPTTEVYRLSGADAELRPLVGTQVRVTGEAPPPEVAIVREASPVLEPRAPTGTSGTGDEAAAEGAKPQVSTIAETRLEVSELLVRSVEKTGERCIG
jgi:hypothetical protein